MHPSLAPEELAVRKEELRAEAEQLRREFRKNAMAFKPALQMAQLGLDIGRELTRCDVFAPSLFGIGFGSVAERAISHRNLLSRLWSGTRWISKTWKIVQAFQHLALPSEMAGRRN